MTPFIVMNNVKEKKNTKRRVYLKPEGKTINIDFIVDLEILTLI